MVRSSSGRTANAVMDEREFSRAIEEIASIAERRGGTAVVALAEPAASESIATCQAYFDTTLPEGLKKFWQQHDGISISVFGPGNDPDRGVPEYFFQIRSAASTREHSRDLRDNFGELRENLDPVYGEDVGRHLVDFATFDDTQRLTLIDLGRPNEAGEAPVLDVDQYDDFYSGTTPPIAESLDAFLERCLRFMIDTDGHGFRYWYGTEDLDW